MKRSGVDLTNYSFDQFVTFLFAREIPETNPEGEKRKPWYWNTEVTFSPDQICKYYTQLFQQPEIVLERFSKGQLEEGFWAIQGPNLDCSVHRILEDAELPFAVRAECIRSMFELFKRLFAFEFIDASVYIWL